MTTSQSKGNALDSNIRFTVCLTWTAQYIVYKTEASTLRCTENHTDQYLLFDCHPALDHNLVVIRILNHWTVKERGVKESIHVKLEWPSLNRGGGLRHYLSPTYNAVLSYPHRQLNNHSHLGSPNSSNPHGGWLDQQPTSSPNASLKLRAQRVYWQAHLSGKGW